MNKERYENLDGFRAYACIGIVLMHIRANGNFEISGFFYDRVIMSFTNFTFLFMLLSAFSMCCGYYERFKSNSISLEQFYRRRYQRIWPFFALLCTVELLVEHSLTSLYEWFADLTLAFGLLPNARISVVGVGWFLGVVFVFYMIFPFFVFLMKNKKRAWTVLIISVVMSILCYLYFFDADHVIEAYSGRNNFLFCSMFFVAGGLIYLYRDQIKTKLVKYKWALMIATIASIIFYYTVSNSEYTMLVVFSLFTILGILGGGISKVVFQNRIIHFLNSVSMEMYLCHMFVYRTLEKLKLAHLTGNEVLNYAMVAVATICGAILLAFVVKQVISMAGKNVSRCG